MRHKITEETLALVPKYGPYGEPQTLLIQEQSEVVLEGHPIKLIEESCLYFGSSMRGRIEAARHILGPNRKTPVLIDWKAQTIFFPTTAKEKAECIWINFKQMKTVQKRGILFKWSFKQDNGLIRMPRPTVSNNNGSRRWNWRMKCNGDFRKNGR